MTKNRSTGRILAAGLMALVLGAAIASADQEGTAQGTLTIDGKTTPLLFAYARAQKGFFDPTKEDVLVILSDVAISEDALADEFALQRLAVSGKLHAVEVRLNPEREPISGGFLHEAFSKTQGFVSVTGMHQFEPKTSDASLLGGTLSMAKPDEFMGKTFSYSATFQAPVWHRPLPTASGEAAAATEPGKAVLAFLKAARTGKKSEIQRLFSAEAAKQFDGEHGQEILEFLKATTPDPATAKIDSVTIHDRNAQVDVVEESKDGSTTSHLQLVLESGQWKVSGS